MERNPILVVDDETSYLELMKSLLNQEGYINVITRENPLEVLPLLERTDVDLILLDIFMPQMNGLDLLEKIYSDYPSIPVIVITAVNEVQIALKAIKLGGKQAVKPQSYKATKLGSEVPLNSRTIFSAGFQASQPSGLQASQPPSRAKRIGIPAAR